MVGPRPFYWVVMADTHVIDDTYEGPEGSPLDTETILRANERFAAVRDQINDLGLPVAFSAIVGDVIHDYASRDYDYYFVQENRPAIDIAVETINGFDMPVYIGLGNHDYDVPHFSREDTHRLFKEKMGIEPYYFWDHQGWRFVHLNSQLGPTWDEQSDQYNRGLGSLGRTQLAWLDEVLQDGLPSFVFVHHHAFSFLAKEDREGPFEGLDDVLERHSDTVRLTISGHLHRWVDLGDKLVIGATRFDEDAFFVVRCDPSGRFEILNREAAHWLGSHPDGSRGGIEPWALPDNLPR